MWHFDRDVSRLVSGTGRKDDGECAYDGLPLSMWHFDRDVSRPVSGAGTTDDDECVHDGLPLSTCCPSEQISISTDKYDMTVNGFFIHSKAIKS